LWWMTTFSSSTTLEAIICVTCRTPSGQTKSSSDRRLCQRSKELARERDGEYSRKLLYVDISVREGSSAAMRDDQSLARGRLRVVGESPTRKEIGCAHVEVSDPAKLPQGVGLAVQAL